MRALTTPVKRLWDAVHAFFVVLFGRRTTRKLTATARVKHAAALQTDLLEVASLLEKMHAWTSRMAARDSRAAKKILDEGAETPATPGYGATPPMTPRDRKQMLRAFMSARQFGVQGVAPPPLTPVAEQLDLTPDPNGDEPFDVEESP